MTFNNMVQKKVLYCFCRFFMCVMPKVILYFVIMHSSITANIFDDLMIDFALEI